MRHEALVNEAVAYTIPVFVRDVDHLCILFKHYLFWVSHAPVVYWIDVRHLRRKVR